MPRQSGRRPAARPSAPPKPAEPAPPFVRLREQPIDPEKYPNLAAHHQLARALRIHRAMQQGMTREQAIQHADEHVAGRRPAKTQGAAASHAKPSRKTPTRAKR